MIFPIENQAHFIFNVFKCQLSVGRDFHPNLYKKKVSLYLLLTVNTYDNGHPNIYFVKNGFCDVSSHFLRGFSSQGYSVCGIFKVCL